MTKCLGLKLHPHGSFHHLALCADTEHCWQLHTYKASPAVRLLRRPARSSTKERLGLLPNYDAATSSRPSPHRSASLEYALCLDSAAGTLSDLDRPPYRFYGERGAPSFCRPLTASAA
jgi:hypothetical protein